MRRFRAGMHCPPARGPRPSPSSGSTEYPWPCSVTDLANGCFPLENYNPWYLLVPLIIEIIENSKLSVSASLVALHACLGLQ